MPRGARASSSVSHYKINAKLAATENRKHGENPAKVEETMGIILSIYLDGI